MRTYDAKLVETAVDPIRMLAVDARSLREPQPFRRLWFGQLISMVGRQITLVAVPYQVYSLTRSALDVGLLGIVQVVPLICGSLGGGAIADRLRTGPVLARALKSSTAR